MVNPTRPSAGEFCWMDLKTRDVPGTADFFATVLGRRFAIDERDWRRATVDSCRRRAPGEDADKVLGMYSGLLPHPQ